MTALLATYDLLGVAIRVEVSDEAAARRVGSLLAETPLARRRPDHVLRLVHGEPIAERGRTLLHGDDVVRERMAPHLAVSMFLWYLQQVTARTDRHALVHAGCVAREGRGIVLAGPMEVGKSTLVTALVLDGFGYLSDELAAVSLADGSLHPYSRPIGLDPGSFPSFPHLRPAVEPGFEDPTKWHLRAEDVRPGCLCGPVPPGAVVFPRYEPDSPLRLEPVSRATCLHQLAVNSMNLEAVGGRGFAALGRLAAGVPGYRLTFSDLKEASRALGDIPPA